MLKSVLCTAVSNNAGSITVDALAVYLLKQLHQLMDLFGVLTSRKGFRFAGNHILSSVHSGLMGYGWHGCQHGS